MLLKQNYTQLGSSDVASRSSLLATDIFEQTASGSQFPSALNGRVGATSLPCMQSALTLPKFYSELCICTSLYRGGQVVSNSNADETKHFSFAIKNPACSPRFHFNKHQREEKNECKCDIHHQT